MAFFHGHTSMLRFMRKNNLKLLGPSLSVNQTWIRRSDHASKSGCNDLKKNQVQKEKFGDFFIFPCFDFLFSSLLSLHYNIIWGKKKKGMKKDWIGISLPWSNDFGGGGGHSSVKLNTTCGQKKYTFGKVHHQNGSEFYQFFSWVDIHGIYFIVKKW